MSKKSNAILLANVRSALNVGAISRTAAAFGVGAIFTGPQTPYPEIEQDTRLPHVRTKATKMISKTSLGAESYLNYIPITNIEIRLAELSQEYFIIGLEQDVNSIDIRNSQNFLSSTKPWLLVLGHETEGLSKKMCDLCHVLVEINHTSNKESLNVSVAAGIALYQLTIMNLPISQ